MNQERLQYLLDAFYANTLSAEEQEELLQYYNSHQVSASWKSKDMGAFGEVKRRIYRKIDLTKTGRMPVKQINARKRNWWTAIAASAVLALSVATYQYYNLHFGTVSMVSGETAKEVVLPDGTKVMLNRNSKLSYKNSFSAVNRQVSFEGEGYFEVVSDSLHPFTVDTEFLKVKVLGTEFNLKAYGEEERIETSLVKGKITILSKDELQTLTTLQPDQNLYPIKRIFIRLHNRERPCLLKRWK